MFITANDLEKKLGTDKKKIFRALKKADIQVIKLGDSWQIRKEKLNDLIEYLEKKQKAISNKRSMAAKKRGFGKKRKSNTIETLSKQEKSPTQTKK